MEEVIDASRVVILDKGHIIEQDTPANLKSKYTTTKLYWYIDKNDNLDELLSNYKYNYEVDHYIVEMNHNDITKFIYENKLEDYEVFRVEY